ncbi:MAG TPA: VCBS repeat-containing protein [Longimicrobiales bacterium]
MRHDVPSAMRLAERGRIAGRRTPRGARERRAAGSPTPGRARVRRATARVVRAGARIGSAVPLAFVLALAPACARGPAPAGTTPHATGPAPAGAAAHGFVRRIDPFPVIGPDGRPYTFPFLGGLNIPRPQLVDIDADGDLDLFVQERSNELMFFENRGERGREGGAGERASAGAFVWRTDRFQELDIGEWYRFVDLDADGDADLLAERPFSMIRYFRNDGGRFVAAADTLFDTTGEPIFSDRQNIPNATDIDCDGLPDLFVGRLTGTVTRYEATAPVGDAPPPFELVTERFENIEIVNTLGASLHGANTLVFTDVEGDGDQDLFWGDFFEPGILLIENNGSCAAPSMRGEPVPFPPGDPVLTSGFNVPAVADLDRDGDFDMLLGVLGGAYNPNRTAADNLYLLENLAASAGAGEAVPGGARGSPGARAAGYTVRTRRFLDGIDLGAESVVEPGDIDGDGDLDLLAAAKLDPAALNTSRIVVFENTGSATRPAFRIADTLDLGASYHFAPELADLDGDGDLDLLLGTWNDGVLIAWNHGDARAPRWARADAPLVTLTRGSHTVPAAADIDGDGDLDLVIGESVGALNLYRNVGTPTDPRFELVSDEYGGFDVGRRSSPTFADLDGDGRPDLVVGHEDGGPECFRNTGGAFEPTACPLPRLLPLAAPRLADLDGDGDHDVIAGTLHGGISYHENRGR